MHLIISDNGVIVDNLVENEEKTVLYLHENTLIHRK